MIKKKKKTPLWSAEHPSRKKAIRIMEYIEEHYDIKIEGIEWYGMEDTLTTIINERNK